MITTQEVEMLAGLVMRAGVNQIEAAWANSILNRLRAAAIEQQAKATLEQKKGEEENVGTGVDGDPTPPV